MDHDVAETREAGAAAEWWRSVPGLAETLGGTAENEVSHCPEARRSMGREPGRGTGRPLIPEEFGGAEESAVGVRKGRSSIGPSERSGHPG